ncbi:uncharacterized protein KY384_005980 [Bacidia gigantensis]|uniref:uncharacterized protein n=1 Tax=Bacidia gigantensis TaxID=2732470 RepID=UPI001D045C9A|nr:uncharacterized protein KY384_005980 [Bacidia gigantensis]KAG8529344.1 hypothetical protein KY384_005980 [Bacidia gigantensis]
MKATPTLTALLSLCPSALTKPIDKRQDFSHIDYPPGTGEDLHEYPGAGENLPSYPAGTGENLDVYPGAGENLPSYPPGTGENAALPDSIFYFTSTYHIVATPDQVVNGTTNPTFTGGLEGAQGFYDFGINVNLDLICYSIKLVGFRGEYQSPAKTATHVHSAAKGKNGPPRLAFPNPAGDGDVRYSFGCLQGPFSTGLVMEGKDTGEGFTLSQIEENPSGFMADVHSSLAVPGAVRGQFPG